MKIKTFFILLLIPFISLQAQTTKEEVMSNILQAGGTYFSYPTPKGKLTPAPKGYKPFYISHYGRHGSRYMTSDTPYKYAIATLDSAEKYNFLTPLGKDVLSRLQIASKDAYKRAGDLSKLGARQHQGIARRMYQNFPEVFANSTKVDARASVVMRCAISMSNFCQQLRALNPKLQISMDASQHDMYYIANRVDDNNLNKANDKAIREKMEAFKEKVYQPARLMSSLFSNKDFVEKNVKQIQLMDNLYNIAEDMQCLPELKLSFFDLFTKEELFSIWQYDNVDWCYWVGLFSTSTPFYKAHYNLLKNILDTADEVIKSGNTAATLRFGHDSIVVPLSYLLHLKGCDDITDDFDSLYKHWSSFKVTPMAANIQIIFYRKTNSKDILVKFLKNENETSVPIKTDCAPYYHWKDVEAYYRAELQK